LEGGATGFMPFKEQFGFVAASGGETTLHRTIAHELGHGAFRLRHTFSEKAFVSAQGATDNLMDYAEGTKLWKYQWDGIQNPENMMMAFAEDEEEGEMDIKKDPILVKKILNAIRLANENGQSTLDLSEYWPTNRSYNQFVSGNIDIGDGMTTDITLYNEAKAPNNIIQPLYNTLERKDYRTEKKRVLLFKCTQNNLYLRIIINEKYFHNVGMYLFGKKWNDEFISTDRKWVLYIYSPNISKSFREAYASNDLLEMRRLTYWALTNSMENDYLDRFYEDHCNIPGYTGGYGARLQSNIRADEDGVTVYVRSNGNNILYESFQFDVIPRNGYKDANYPVDINLYDGSDKPSLGTVYYKDYDFRGTFGETSTALGVIIKEVGFIWGHLKGFGYTEYYYENTAGFAWSFPSFFVGVMTGKYVGQGIASPNSFIGKGETDFIGTNVLLGTWNSHDDNDNIVWQGEIAGVGISIPIKQQFTEKIKNVFLRLVFDSGGNISGGNIKTDTQINFPNISPKTKNIFDVHYDKKN
jgi:hypothetical protein